MLVEVKENNLGDIIIPPVNRAHRDKIEEHLGQFGVESDGTAYLQGFEEKTAFCDEFLSREQVDDIENGFTVEVEADAWTLPHCFGWDCHPMAENGEIA